MTLTTIFPRRERFEPPERIYLAPDVNAAVFQRGGLLGFGGKRVLLVGLPLFDALTVRQLRAVIAHEFGHFYGGDSEVGIADLPLAGAAEPAPSAA